MTPAQAAYRAGCIVSEVEARYAGKRRLSPACLGNCSRLPAKIPVFLRHLWPKAIKDEAVVALLDGWKCPDRPFADVESGPFWIGYYHQKTARGLPLSFPDRLRALRESAGLSVEALATAAGLTRQAVHNYEAGERRPTWQAVQQLATALGVSTDAFRESG